MFKTTLIAVTTVLLFVTGCSSSNDPKDIAMELCEYSKKGDVASIKKYAAPALKTQLDQIQKMIEMATSTDEGKKMFETQMQKFTDVKCTETTTVTENKDGSVRVTNPKIQQFYTLKLVDGSWQMFQ